jgi:hypothetical protein
VPVTAGVVALDAVAALLALQMTLAQGLGATGQDVVADLPLFGVEI